MGRSDGRPGSRPAATRWARLAVLLLSVGCNETQDISLDSPMHFRSGGRGRLADATVTVRVVPKKLVQGNEAEIDRFQIETLRGTDHAVMQLDAQNSRAVWGGYSFTLGPSDVERDDIVVTVHQR